jgi:hypothetical protein
MVKSTKTTSSTMYGIGSIWATGGHCSAVVFCGAGGATTIEWEEKGWKGCKNVSYLQNVGLALIGLVWNGRRY